MTLTLRQTNQLASYQEMKKELLARSYGWKPKEEVKTVEYLGSVWGCPKVLS